MSVISEEMVGKAVHEHSGRLVAGDNLGEAMTAALNAVLPDILEEAAKVADEEAAKWQKCTANVANSIRALADTATVQEKG